MKYRTGDYVLKIWLTSMVAGPLLLLILSLSKGGSWRADDFTLLFVTFLFSILFSSPSLALFYFAARFGLSTIGNTVSLKVILTVAGALLTYIPFLVIDGFHPLLDADQLSRLLFTLYGSVTVIGICIYQIKPLPPPIVDQPETIHI